MCSTRNGVRQGEAAAPTKRERHTEQPGPAQTAQIPPPEENAAPTAKGSTNREQPEGRTPTQPPHAQQRESTGRGGNIQGKAGNHQANGTRNAKRRPEQCRRHPELQSNKRRSGERTQTQRYPANKARQNATAPPKKAQTSSPTHPAAWTTGPKPTGADQSDATIGKPDASQQVSRHGQCVYLRDQIRIRY